MTRLDHPRASRLAIAFWGAVLLLFSPVVLSPQTVADWDWLNENFHKALDATLPIRKNCGACVSYRSYETLQVGDVEYSLLITRDATQSKKGYKAHIRMPDTVPLGQQLLVMHQKQQDEPVASMERDLRFMDWDLTEAQCPAIKSQYEKLRSLHVPLPSDTLVVDPTIYQFHIQEFSGEWNLIIVDEQNALVKWALETRHLLEPCAVGQKPDKH